MKPRNDHLKKSLIGYWQRQAHTLTIEEFNALAIDFLILRNKGGYQFLTEALELPADTDTVALQNHLKTMPREKTLLIQPEQRA